MALLPGLQHLAVLRDLVLAFLGAHQIAGLMFSSPMNTQLQPARAAFSMNPGILWHSVSTCMQDFDLEAVLLAQLDQPVENRFPVLVAGEIVVGDEEPRQPWRALSRTSASTSSAER